MNDQNIGRAIPILPCPDIDEIAPFYEALGFEITYRQMRPNPYLCLKLGGIDLHFFGLAELVAEDSMATAIILVSDTAALFETFSQGLKKQYGKLPMTGIPRITRPRRKQGTSGGFTVVDPGGNWLRVTAAQDDETDAKKTGPLERILLNATRQGDARGDVPQAIAVIEAGMLRNPDATPAERIPLLAYLAELQHRQGDEAAARDTVSIIQALPLTEAELTALKPVLLEVEELKEDLSLA